jgi:hypothetical protein
MTIHPLARIARPAALAGLVLVTACASIDVSSYVERGYDVSRLQTYAWGPQSAVPTGDPRLDSNPFFDEHVRGAIDVQLAMQGRERTPRNPDVLVHYHANMTQRIDTKDLDRLAGACERGGCQPEVYDAGTIVIDLVDARTHALVWRGWAEGSMEGVVDDQAWMEARINKAITRILRRLPRLL